MKTQLPIKEIVLDDSYQSIRVLRFTLHTSDAIGWFLTHAGTFGVVDSLNDKLFQLRVYDGYDLKQVSDFILAQGGEVN